MYNFYYNMLLNLSINFNLTNEIYFTLDQENIDINKKLLTNVSFNYIEQNLSAEIYIFYNQSLKD